MTRGVFDDLTGKVFGRLRAVRQGPNRPKGAQWVCRCECGNYTQVRGQYLKGGQTKSCGCAKAYMCREKMLETWKTRKCLSKQD